LIGYFSKKYVVTRLHKEISSYSHVQPYLEVDYVTGADLFVAKSIVEKCGGFDPTYFMYFEESDLQYTMHAHGYINAIINGPEIIHFQGSSDLSPHFSPAKRIMNDTSMFYYLRKHSRIIEYVLFRIGYFLVKLPLLIDRRVSFVGRLNYQRFLLTNK